MTARIYTETLPSGRASFVVKFQKPDGRRGTKRFRTEAEAEMFKARVVIETEDGRFIDPAAGRVRVEDFIQHVLKTERYEAATLELNQGFARRYVEPHLGDLRLDYVANNPAVIKTFIRTLQDEGVGDATIARMLTFLRRVFTIAVQERRVAFNPCQGVTPPKHDARKAFFLTPEQVDRIATEAGDDGILVLTLAYTGLRFGELAGLRVGDVDILGHRLIIRESMTEVGGVQHRKKTKTNRERIVPLPDFLELYLLGHIPDLTDEDALVFTTGRGTALRGSNFRNRVLGPAARRAGVLRPVRDADGAITMEPPHPHDLRHTFVALAQRAGYSMFEVSRMVGHASIKTTADRYGHLFEDFATEKVARMNAMKGANR